MKTCFLSSYVFSTLKQEKLIHPRVSWKTYNNFFKSLKNHICTFFNIKKTYLIYLKFNHFNKMFKYVCVCVRGFAKRNLSQLEVCKFGTGQLERGPSEYISDLIFFNIIRNGLKGRKK